MDKAKKVVVLPCSGIGKAYGALARETAYELAERVWPGVATLTCLPLLVINDPAARQLVTENPASSARRKNPPSKSSPKK